MCYVTPSEHLKLPSIQDVVEGVIATRIAAHAADIARGNQKALQKDLDMAKARKSFDWKKQIEEAVLQTNKKLEKMGKDKEAELMKL